MKKPLLWNLRNLFSQNSRSGDLNAAVNECLDMYSSVYTVQRELERRRRGGRRSSATLRRRAPLPPRLALRFELKKQLQFHFVAAGAKTTGCEVCVHGRRRFFCVVPTLF